MSTSLGNFRNTAIRVLLSLNLNGIHLIRIYQIFQTFVYSKSDDVLCSFTLLLTQAIVVGYIANSTDPDETAHHEPSHLDLCRLTFRHSK